MTFLRDLKFALRSLARVMERIAQAAGISRHADPDGNKAW
jgi:hypothetical protein